MEGNGIQNEFDRLLREYRNIEHDRKMYSEETENKLKNQKSSMEKLRKENEVLRAELNMETRSNSNRTSGASKLAQLQDLADTYTQKIETERRQADDLEGQILKCKEKILEKRKTMGGVNAAKENQQMVQKQIRILENRLDKALIKFNEALAHNKRLREQIDNLRRERVVFDGIYRKLERELHEKKKQMANIIELSNAAYEQRDNAQMELAALQNQNQQEIEDFDAEMEELNRQLEQEKKMKDLISSKDKKGGGDGVRGELSMDEEKSFKKKVAKGSWNIAKEKAAMTVNVQKVESYYEAFEKIKAATGISDIDELVSTFVANEDQNYSLFTYVNELNTEIEKLEEAELQLKEEESKYNQESGDDADQHKQLVKDLQAKLNSADTMDEKYEQKCEEHQKTINSLKVGVSSIFNKLDCSKEGLSEMLGDANVTESNLMIYLGAIEGRTNEVLQMYSEFMREQGHNPPMRADGPDMMREKQSTPQALVSILGQGPNTPVGHDQVSIVPPALDDYSSEEEEEEEDMDARPLTRDELKNKTLKGIHKKEVSSGPRKGRGYSGGSKAQYKR